MTRFTNNAEGGTNGVAVSTTNSDALSGTAWSLVSVGAGGSITFSTDRAAQGTKSYKYVNPSAATNYLRYDLPAATDQYYLGFFFYIEAAQTVATEMINVRTTASATSMQLTLNTSGRFTLTQNGTGIFTSANNAVVSDTWMYIEVGMSRTANTYNFRATRVDDGTVLATSTGTLGGTTNWGQLRVGKMSSSTSTNTWYYDAIVLDDTKYALEGVPVVVPNPPDAVASLNTAWARIDATASTAGNGGALSYAISPSTGTITPASGVFFVPTGATYTITVTEGAQSDTVTVVVPTASAGGGNQRVSWNGTAWV